MLNNYKKLYEVHKDRANDYWGQIIELRKLYDFVCGMNDKYLNEINKLNRACQRKNRQIKRLKEILKGLEDVDN